MRSINAGPSRSLDRLDQSRCLKILDAKQLHQPFMMPLRVPFLSPYSHLAATYCTSLSTTWNNLEQVGTSWNKLERMKSVNAAKISEGANRQVHRKNWGKEERKR